MLSLDRAVRVCRIGSYRIPPVCAVCRLCNHSDVNRFYDSDSSTCKDCSDHISGRVAILTTMLVVGLLATVLVLRYGRGVSRQLRRRHARLLTKWMPIVQKLRIAWSSYQILIQVPTIYQLSLPSSVASVFASLLPILDLGINRLVSMPLECMNLRGYGR